MEYKYEEKILSVNFRGVLHYFILFIDTTIVFTYRTVRTANTASECNLFTDQIAEYYLSAFLAILKF